MDKQRLLKLANIPSTLNESVINEGFYKSIMGDGGRNLFFAIVDDKTDDVKIIDAKTWLKSSMMDNASDVSKDRVIKAILRNQKQFNKKVEYNMWAKKNNPSFEEKMDYFFKNNFIGNITKRGIKVYESINESKVHYQKKLKNGTTFQVIGRDTKGMRGTQDKFQMQIVDKSGKVVKDLGSHPSVKGAEKFGNKFESINEGYTGNSGDKLTHKYDKNIEIELIEPTNRGWKVYQTYKGKKRKIAYFDKQDIVGNKALFESINESDDTTSLKKIHDSVFKFLKTKKGVGEVKELSEFPNRYGDNVSTFSVRYNIEDKYNYDKQEIKIEYSTSRVFIPNKGYFPFKTFNDIKNIINKKSKLKESVNESDVKKKINRRGDVDGLLVKHNGKEYHIVYSGDFGISSTVMPYGIVMPDDDTVSFLSKDRNAKTIWKQLKPKVDKFLKSNESVNERYRPNLESKGWEAAQKVIRQLQSSVFKKLDDDELLEFRKAMADAFNLDGILK